MKINKHIQKLYKNHCLGSLAGVILKTRAYFLQEHEVTFWRWWGEEIFQYLLHREPARVSAQLPCCGHGLEHSLGKTSKQQLTMLTMWSPRLKPQGFGVRDLYRDSKRTSEHASVQPEVDPEIHSDYQEVDSQKSSGKHTRKHSESILCGRAQSHRCLTASVFNYAIQCTVVGQLHQTRLPVSGALQGQLK